MITIGNLQLAGPIFNASGPRCTTLEELQDLNRSMSSAILTKSCTLEPRIGNLGKRYWQNDLWSINSTGLANLGWEFYRDNSQGWDKPYIVSVAGLNLEDNIKIINGLQGHVGGIELNLSCPNIRGKRQVAYSYDMMEFYLRKIFDEDSIDSTFGLKLSPYFDHCQFVEISEIINEFKTEIDFVTCVNSLGNGYLMDGDQPAIEANGGFGGIGGKAILPIGLGNVSKFRVLLHNSIAIIGCGGITTGQDVKDYLSLGATAVQVGTAFMERGTSVFEQLYREILY